MSNQQLAVIKEICTTIDKMDNQLKQALPPNMEVSRFIATVKNGIQTHPQQDKLASADRRTLFASCLKAASDGLVLDGREAALVVFANQVTYMPMTQGLVKLARNSGEIAKITSEVVYKNDTFQYRLGVDDVPLHEPDWFGDRGEAVGVWCCVKLNSGENIVRVLPKVKVLNIASKTKNASQYDPKSGLYFDEFWRKTAIKNALKYAPKSTYLESAMNHDNEAQGFDFNEPKNNDNIVPIKKEETRAASKIKAAMNNNVVEEVEDAVFTEEVVDTVMSDDLPFDDDI